MQEKRLPFRQDDFIAHHPIERGADFMFGAAQIDKRRGMPAEGTKLVAEPHVNGRAVDAFNRRARRNRQLAVVEPGFNIAIA